MTFAPDSSAGYLVNHLARLMERGLRQRIAPLGLSTGTFPALLALWEKDGLTQKELVAQLDIEQATMANTLARMERDGLVTRQRDAHDGRAQRIHLTAKARGLHDAAIAAATQENASALKALSAAEQETFLTLLRKVIATRAKEPDA